MNSKLTPSIVGLLLILLSIICVAFVNKSTTTLPNPEMVKIEGGTFIMGQDSGEGDEKPEHEVELSTFYIGKYEVTVSEFRTFCEATDRDMPKTPKWGWKEDHPIVNCTWNDAMAYINWLNETKNDNYRLPTEAEFEYVIRNGGKPGVYPWKDEEPQNENLADISFKKVTSSSRIWSNYDDGFPNTAPVGSFEPNDLGVYDINGNIWEWCNDWYQEYSSEKQVNPKGPDSGNNKVGRGGSYNADPWHSRTASRAWVEPSFEAPGFRLAKDFN